VSRPYVERDAWISPNGRWIAYVSEEAGRPEVSVRSLLGPPHRVVISGEGGDQPVWRRDGAELFFVGLHGRLRSVSVHPGTDGSLACICFMYENDDAPPREINVVTDRRALSSPTK
jgi:Tol biopolymer transport system component